MAMRAGGRASKDQPNSCSVDQAAGRIGLTASGMKDLPPAEQIRHAGRRRPGTLTSIQALAEGRFENSPCQRSMFG
jgi:hypothetical protein